MLANTSAMFGNLENTIERKKNTKENDFLTFG